jgi:hypothetical protein
MSFHLDFPDFSQLFLQLLNFSVVAYADRLTAILQAKS